MSDDIKKPWLKSNQKDIKNMSTEMLEEICDGSQYHPNVNRRELGYKIRDSI